MSSSRRTTTAEEEEEKYEKREVREATERKGRIEEGKGKQVKPFTHLPERAQPLKRNPKFLEFLEKLETLSRARSQTTTVNQERESRTIGKRNTNLLSSSSLASSSSRELVVMAQRRHMMGKAWEKWSKEMYWKYCEKMGSVYRDVCVVSKCLQQWRERMKEEKRKQDLADYFHRYHQTILSLLLILTINN